jgi:hypothetical protein
MHLTRLERKPSNDCKQQGRNKPIQCQVSSEQQSENGMGCQEPSSWVKLPCELHRRHSESTLKTINYNSRNLFAMLDSASASLSAASKLEIHFRLRSARSSSPPAVAPSFSSASLCTPRRATCRSPWYLSINSPIVSDRSCLGTRDIWPSAWMR